MVMFRVRHPMVSIFLNFFDLLECPVMLMTLILVNTQQNFSDKDIDIKKIRKAFSKFYRRHFDTVSKYNVGLKKLLLEGLSEPEFYGDLVYKFRKIVGKNDFPYHFKKIIVRYKKIGCNIDVLRQTACLVVNPIMDNSFAYLFNCTTVGRASD